MTKTNLPNPDSAQRLGQVQLLHGRRGFFPTDRQLQLYQALFSAPCPAPDADPDADRLTLPGIGGRLRG